MLKLFTYPGSIESEKTKQWLNKNQITYVEKNLFDQLMTIEELKQITSLTELGAIDIIADEYLSVVSHIIKDDDISLTELYDFIQKEPKLVKLPILVDDKRLMIGYNEKILNKFLPEPPKLIVEY